MTVTDQTPDPRPTEAGAALATPPPTGRLLAPTESLPWGLRRITLGQFDRIIGALMDHDADLAESVHTARKTMKRLRGLLRLVRDEIGYERYRPENVVLRDTSRRLAGTRDAAVMVETVDDLRDRFARHLKKRTFGHTRDYFADAYGRRVIELEADRQLILDVVTTLKTTRSRYATWPIAEPHHGAKHVRAPLRDTFTAIEGGLRRTYTRGRDGLHRAANTRREVDFHDWRKRVKYLRYQFESLELLWPESMGLAARQLDDLGELLGLEHDLAVLAERLVAEPMACPDSSERSLLLAVIHQSRFELQAQALPLGTRLYAEHPEAFAARIGAYWAAARG
jgi:CHAD domain-containing protein